MDFLQGYSEGEDEEYENGGVGPVGQAEVFVERELALPSDDEAQGEIADEESSSSSDDEYGPRPVATSTPMNKPVTSPPEASESSVPLRPVLDSVDAIAQHKQIPISSEISLTGHEKAVTTLSIEPAGNRVVTGSLDYHVRIFDFGGMDSRHRSFQSIEVEDSHAVSSISHSPNGDKFVVAASSCQPKVFDRDGQEIIKFVRGDVYLRDLSHTKGHTMEVTCVAWHPIEKNEILTSSLDGSLRVWDLTGEATFGMLINKHVLKARHVSGQQHQRLAVTSCLYSNDGQKIIGGVSNGSIQIWFCANKRTLSSKADCILLDKSLENVSVVSLAVCPHNETLAVRYENGTVLLWSIAKLSSSILSASSTSSVRPFKRFDHLMNAYPTANMSFSPNGALLCLATSPQQMGSTGQVDEANRKSRVHFFEVDKAIAAESSKCLSIAVMPSATSVEHSAHSSSSQSAHTAISVKWQWSTNQIFCTMSSGEVKVFYDPQMSKKGALLSAKKAPKREKDPTDFAAVGEIFNPLALPMYRQQTAHEKVVKRVATLKDPMLAKIPEKPSTQGPGKRENTSFFFTNYVMNSGISIDRSRAEDPREALLKMDAKAKADPVFIGRAYLSTQPQNKLAEKTFEQEQEEYRAKKQKPNT